MPNWTYNQVSITADTKEEIVKIQQLLKNGENVFDFNRVCPVPVEFDEIERFNAKMYSELSPDATPESYLKIKDMMIEDAFNDFGYTSGYDFRVSEWGTKWNSCDARGDEIIALSVAGKPNLPTVWSIYYAFETAWAPPVALLGKLSKKFPNVEIELNAQEEAELFEPFCMKFKAGKIIFEEVVERDDDEEYERLDPNSDGLPNE